MAKDWTGRVATVWSGVFALGDRVTKISGSPWAGRVVGYYSTALTNEGYCVESESEPGSVQIYPVNALRGVEDAARQDTTITNNTGSDFVVENAYFERVGNAWETGDGWRPIETAPKDGTEVLVYVPRRLGAIYAAASNPTGNQWWARNMGDLRPTHWMPLPTPPEGE